MPQDETCSFCYVERHQMMQRTPYSSYDEYYKSRLETINQRCGLSGPTEIKEFPLDPLPVEEAPCFPGETYTTSDGDTCTSIARAHNISSAALYMGNQGIIGWCSSIKPGLELCLPLPCQKTYELQPADTCSSIEYAFQLNRGDVRKFNSWVTAECDNLETASAIYGTNICLSPQGGEHVTDKQGSGTTPSTSDGHVWLMIPPPDNATVAEGTTTMCGRWHEARVGESCVAICLQNMITHALFVEVNPSLDSVDCSTSLTVGETYCTGPTYDWDMVVEGNLTATFF